MRVIYFLPLILLCSGLAFGQVLQNTPWQLEISPLAAASQTRAELLVDKQPESYLEAGKAYLFGKGVKKNPRRAKKYLEKAAQKDLREAKLLLALLPVYTNSQNASQLQKAFEQTLQLAKEDYPLAQFAAASLYAQGQGTPEDPAASVKWLIRAATAAVPVAQAQNKLGEYYYYGYAPFVEKNTEKAFALFLAAAETEEIHAAYNVACLYLRAEGTAKNEKRAFYFMRQAARGKLVQAQMALSDLYQHGTGVKADAYGAFQWMYEAARQHNVTAQEQTALNYLYGRGIPVSHKEALLWAEKAQKNGSTKAADIIQQIKSF